MILRNLAKPLAWLLWAGVVLLASYAAASWASLWPLEVWQAVNRQALQVASLLFMVASLSMAWSGWRKWYPSDRRRIAEAVAMTAGLVWFFWQVIELARGS